jgi:hypothetical protein
MPTRKHYTKKLIKKGGNCGCNQHITGGVGLGSATSISVGTQNTIPFNNHNMDPLAPASQIATRMEPNPIAPWNPFLSGGQRSGGQMSVYRRSGGKRIKRSGRKSKKTGGKRRKSTRKRIRGGDRNSDAILNGPLYSTGTSMGAPIGSNIIMGNTLDILNPPNSNASAPFI